MNVSRKNRVPPHKHLATDIVGEFVDHLTPRSLGGGGANNTIVGDGFVSGDWYVGGRLFVSKEGTFDNLLILKDPAESGYWLELHCAMVQDPDYPTVYNPILHLSQGMWGMKDISILGFLGSASPARVLFSTSGYTDCVLSDIGKAVKDDGTNVGWLAHYDNSPETPYPDWNPSGYPVWWIIAFDGGDVITSGSAMTIQNGTGAGTTNQTSKYLGGGAMILGHGFTAETDMPRIVLSDTGFDILEIMDMSENMLDVRLRKLYLRDTVDALIKYDNATTTIKFRNAGDTAYVQLDENCYEGGGGLFTNDILIQKANPYLTLDATSGEPNIKWKISTNEAKIYTTLTGGFHLVVDTAVSIEGNVNLGNYAISGNSYILSNTELDAPTLEIGSTEVISSGRVLSNVTADAGIITSGVFGTAQIPSLDASKITTGVFGTGRIPNLDASKITTGTFGVDRIPTLDYSKVSFANQNMNTTNDVQFNSVKGTASGGALKAGVYNGETYYSVSWDSTKITLTAHLGRHFHLGTDSGKHVYVDRALYVSGGNIEISAGKLSTNTGVDSYGNILIEKASPTLTLKATTASNANIVFYDNNTEKWIIYWHATSDYLDFYDSVGTKSVFQLMPNGDIKLPVSGADIIFAGNAYIKHTGTAELTIDDDLIITGSLFTDYLEAKGTAGIICEDNLLADTVDRPNIGNSTNYFNSVWADWILVNDIGVLTSYIRCNNSIIPDAEDIDCGLYASGMHWNYVRGNYLQYHLGMPDWDEVDDFALLKGMKRKQDKDGKNIIDPDTVKFLRNKEGFYSVADVQGFALCSLKRLVIEKEEQDKKILALLNRMEKIEQVVNG